MATLVGKVGMVMKGVWSNSATYEVLDAVSYNNGLYIAKQAVPANTAPTNTTYWQSAIDFNDVSYIGNTILNTYKADGITSVSGSITKVGRMLTINCAWNGDISGNVAILNLPSALRPASIFTGAGMIYRYDLSQNVPGTVNLTTDGDILEVTTSARKTSGFFNLTYYI